MHKLTTDSIAALRPYEPGKPIEEVMRELGLARCVKLASNENALGPSPLARKALEAALDEIGRYPDSSGYHLKARIAAHHGVPADHVVLGNGSVEIIELIVRTFLGPEEEALVSRDGFIMYWVAIQAANGRGVQIPAREHRHDLEAMADAVNDRTKLLFIANPNNPTGTMVSREEVARLLSRVPSDVIVILDEAYTEYIKDPAYPDGVEWVRSGSSVIVLHTFSKVYGLAGLRVGYGLARPELVVAMEKVRTPFNTSVLAQRAAIAALDDVEHVERSYRVNVRERAFLEEGLGELRLAHVPSVANFLMVDLGRPCVEAFEALLRMGVIVRPLAGYGFPTHVRITVGTRPENEELLRALARLQAAR